MQVKRFSEDIKERSGSSHQALEKVIISHIRSIHCIEDYQDLLRLFYGYYKPLEEKIREQLSRSLIWSNSRQAELLENDLTRLNHPVSDLLLCNTLPAVGNKLQALAALYVLEGSTLGGKYILMMIRKQIQLESGVGDTFFTGHGNDTEKNWQRFKLILDEEISEPQQEEFLSSVNETFERFKKWAELKYQYDEQE